KGLRRCVARRERRSHPHIVITGGLLVEHWAGQAGPASTSYERGSARSLSAQQDGRETDVDARTEARFGGTGLPSAQDADPDARSLQAGNGVRTNSASDE